MRAAEGWSVRTCARRAAVSDLGSFHRKCRDTCDSISKVSGNAPASQVWRKLPKSGMAGAAAEPRGTIAGTAALPQRRGNSATFDLVVSSQRLQQYKLLKMSDLSNRYPLLESIKEPADLRHLPAAKLTVLADELRQFLIQSVSTRGGHFAAGLGTVELTIALHYIFNTPYDRLVWDVGHQAYPHKVLTGRRE